MAIPNEIQSLASSAPEAPPSSLGTPRDPRTLGILAKTIYRELRQSGLAEEEVMSVAGELLSLVALELRDRRAR
jgi:hypothetical protein